jgi:hypothetical protein
MKIFAMMSISFLMAFSAFADCKQANLTSQDGVNVSLHYSSCNMSYGDSGTVSPTIHVTLPAEKCGAQFVYANLVTSQYGSPFTQSVQLSRNPNDSCQFDSKMITVNQGYEGIADQQIAVSIEENNNWAWLTDPVTQSHNFDYRFDASYCGGPQGQTVEVCN